MSLRAFVCPAPKDEYFMVFDLTIVPILCSISLIFLAALFVYLAFLKPRQRFREQQLRRMQQRGLDVARLPPSAVASKPQIVIGLFEAMTLSLVAMLFFFYFFLIVGKTAQKPLLLHFYPGCIANGLLLQVIISHKNKLYLLYRTQCTTSSMFREQKYG